MPFLMIFQCLFLIKYFVCIWCGYLFVCVHLCRCTCLLICGEARGWCWVSSSSCLQMGSATEPRGLWLARVSDQWAAGHLPVLFPCTFPGLGPLHRFWGSGVLSLAKWFLKFYIKNTCVCMCGACGGQRTTLWALVLLLLYGSWGLNSGLQA